MLYRYLIDTPTFEKAITAKAIYYFFSVAYKFIQIYI